MTQTAYIRIIIDRAAAIRAGRTEYGETIVPVPPGLTPAQREALLACPVCGSGSRDDARYYADPYRVEAYSTRTVDGLPALADAGPESIGALLDARAAAIAAMQVADAAAIEAAVAAVLAAPAADWWDRDGSEWDLGIPPVDCPREHLRSTVASDPRVKARRAEITPDRLAYRQRLADERAAREAAEAQARAARTAREAEAQARLRAWAEAHGSERLHLMLQTETGDWVTTARHEYTDAVAPRLGDVSTHCPLSRDDWDNADSVADRRSPTLRELRGLAAAQQLCREQPKQYRDPRLLWATEQPDDDYEADDYDSEPAEPTRYAILALDVICPDGHARTVARRF